MPIKKYTVVFHTISNSPKEEHYYTENYDKAVRVAERKADEGFLPVYIVDNTLEEVIFDV